jgi:hypothetical protein
MLLYRAPDTLSIPEDRHRGRISIYPHEAVARLRRRGGLGHISGLVDLATDSGVQAVELALTDFRLGREPPHVTIERIILPGPTVDLTSRHIRLIVVLRVSFSPIGHQLDQGDAFTSPGPLHRLLGDLVCGEHVIAVGLHTGDAVPSRLVRQPLGGALLRGGCGVGVSVVLDDHDERATLNRGEIDAFVKGTGGGGAVAHIDQAHARFPPQLKGEGDACHYRNHVTQMGDLTDEVSILHVAEVNVELAAARG